MVRTRQEAAPQAQDYVWGWRDVPAPVRLDVVCGYLDAASMGILEICGKNCLGDAQRAWQAKAAGVAPGSLANVSTKQLVAAQARVDALVGGPFDDFEWQPHEAGRSGWWRGAVDERDDGSCGRVQHARWWPCLWPEVVAAYAVD